jgi:hypothetical protein
MVSYFLMTCAFQSCNIVYSAPTSGYVMTSCQSLMFLLDTETGIYLWINNTPRENTPGFSPQANYTDRATAACRRS